MRRISRPGSFVRNADAVRTAGISLLVLLVSAGFCWAQSPPPQPESKTEVAPKQPGEPEAKTEDKPATPPAAGAGSQTGPEAEAKTAEKSKRAKWARASRADKKRRRPPKIKMDSNAKWACDQQTVTLEPVWRGNKKLTFTFHIRSEGTADLIIKAKGGG